MLLTIVILIIWQTAKIFIFIACALCFFLNTDYVTVCCAENFDNYVNVTHAWLCGGTSNDIHRVWMLRVGVHVTRL